MLSALPTRDAILPILCALATCLRKSAKLSEVVAGFDLPSTAARKLENVPKHVAQRFFHELSQQPGHLASLLSPFGIISNVDTKDGLRATLSGGEVIHFRTSGNEPALRFYVEASSERDASTLLSAVVASLSAD